MALRREESNFSSKVIQCYVVSIVHNCEISRKICLYGNLTNLPRPKNVFRSVYVHAYCCGCGKLKDSAEVTSVGDRLIAGAIFDKRYF